MDVLFLHLSLSCTVRLDNDTDVGRFSFGVYQPIIIVFD